MTSKLENLGGNRPCPPVTPLETQEIAVTLPRPLTNRCALAIFLATASPLCGLAKAIDARGGMLSNPSI